MADLQRRLEEVERASLLGVTDWAATIDERECSEPGHADAVAACAATLAEAAGVGGRELHWIKVGAYLHDVGKAAVPASILRKAGPLTPTERELVQLHAAAGDGLVAGLRFPAAVRLAVRHHHERWDGAGYPDGLAGEAIPLPARIVGLASVWCALTQRRSFRPAFSRAEALRLMAGEAGRGTDPALFRVLASLAERRAEAPPPASDAAWRAGDAFVARLQRVLGARYVLRHEIAGGGMSRIFVASEPRLGRDVVVKTVPPELITAESRARFKQEMGVTARLQHPGVLPVLSSGGRHDVLFYVMPYVSGDSLRQRMQREGALPAAAALGLLDELLDVLEYAHGRGVVHRDIKPENVLLRGPHPLLADFGVARVLSEARLTGTGIAVGTPAYMAPEQRFAEDAADARADLYALGVVAYELLAGQHPFPDARSRLAAQLTGTVTPVHEVGRAVPPAVSAVIATALAPEPERRHQSAAAFRATLRVAAADARASV